MFLYLSSPILFFLRRNSGGDDFFEIKRLKENPTDFSRIRCPLCEWQPQASSRWFCSDFGAHTGCGTTWNTFDTRGRCPGCGYQWLWTDCLRCHQSSPHETWYADEAN